MATPIDYTHVIIGNVIYTLPLVVLSTRSIRDFDKHLVTPATDDNSPQKPLNPQLTIIVRRQGEEYHLAQPADCFIDHVVRHQPRQVICAVLPSEYSPETLTVIENDLQARPAGPVPHGPTQALRALAFDELQITALSKHYGTKVGPSFYTTLVGETALPVDTATKVQREVRLAHAWNALAREHGLPNYQALLRRVPEKERMKFRYRLLIKINAGKDPLHIYQQYSDRFLAKGAQ